MFGQINRLPLGLYVIEGSTLRPGDIALARLPAAVANMAHRRGYLPRTTYLLKPVVAIAGDRVCRLGRRIVVRGAIIARATVLDTAGRPLPAWHGCRELAPDEVFVLARAKHSFDSRYFGPLRRSDILGRAVRVWATSVVDR